MTKRQIKIVLKKVAAYAKKVGVTKELAYSYFLENEIEKEKQMNKEKKNESH